MNKAKENHQILVSHSAKETFNIGFRLGKELPASTVVAFYGDLGAGKTTLIKGLVEGATAIHHSQVQSPTFTFLQIYEGEKTVYHFDLYRLKSIEEFLSMGFDDYFGCEGICCVEWSERLSTHLPEDALKIFMEYRGECERIIRLSHPKIKLSD